MGKTYKANDFNSQRFSDIRKAEKAKRKAEKRAAKQMKKAA